MIPNARVPAARRRSERTAPCFCIYRGGKCAKYLVFSSLCLHDRYKCCKWARFYPWPIFNCEVISLPWKAYFLVFFFGFVSAAGISVLLLCTPRSRHRQLEKRLLARGDLLRPVGAAATGFGGPFVHRGLWEPARGLCRGDGGAGVKGTRLDRGPQPVGCCAPFLPRYHLRRERGRHTFGLFQELGAGGGGADVSPPWWGGFGASPALGLCPQSSASPKLCILLHWGCPDWDLRGRLPTPRVPWSLGSAPALARNTACPPLRVMLR